jgi:hypothetical protein
MNSNMLNTLTSPKGLNSNRKRKRIQSAGVNGRRMRSHNTVNGGSQVGLSCTITYPVGSRAQISK